jgi:hypothetical protein
MRIPRSKVYRAFAELDAYDDARCERFVAAAKGGWVGRWSRRALVIGVTIGLLVGGMAGVLAIMNEVQGDRRTYGDVWAYLATLAIVPGVAAPVLLGVLLRDWLLRRRIGRVLRRLGVCIDCGYGLVGLPVSEEHTVACPECGRVVQVDPALGQLVRDDSGAARFAHGDVATPHAKFWTPARRRLAKRLAIAAVLVFVVLPGTALLINEVRVRVVAARAANVRLTQAQVDEWMARGLGAGQNPASAPDAERNWWGELSRAHELKIKIDGIVGAKGWFNLEKNDPILADPELMRITLPATGTPSQQQTMLLRQAFARELIAEYRKGGLFERTAAIAAAPRAPYSMRVFPTHPVVGMGMAELGSTRDLARTLAARIDLAIEARDLEEYVRADRELGALAAMWRACPMAILRMVGESYDELRDARAADVLCRDSGRGMGPEWLDAIARGQRGRAPGASLEDVLAFEQALWEDRVGWAFEEPAYVRFGSWSPGFEERFGDVRLWTATLGGRASALGSFGQNLREGRAILARARGTTLAEAWQRASLERAGGGAVAPVPTTMFTSLIDLDMARMALDRAMARRRGMEALVAIAMYQQQRGSVAPSLDALVPEFLASVPVDPWTGRALVYRVVDPDLDPHGRGFVLYSVGENELDEGGVAGTLRPAATIGGPGILDGDMLFNRPRE